MCKLPRSGFKRGVGYGRASEGGESGVEGEGWGVGG